MPFTLAREMKHPFVIAIVDESGVLKAFTRMDGAPLLSVQVAQDKASYGGGYPIRWKTRSSAAWESAAVATHRTWRWLRLR